MNSIGLSLAHQLPHEISTNLRIGIAEPRPELVEGHLGIPEEVGMSSLVYEKLRPCRVEHGSRVANLL